MHDIAVRLQEESAPIRSHVTRVHRLVVQEFLNIAAPDEPFIRASEPLENWLLSRDARATKTLANVADEWRSLSQRREVEVAPEPP